MADLTPKQARFVDEYLIDLNGTQAAIRAGYSADTAQEQASRLLSNVMVAEAVAERQKGIQVSTHVTQERVIREIARIALFDPRKMFDDDGRPLHVSQLDEDTAAAIAGLEVVTKGNADMGFGRCLGLVTRPANRLHVGVVVCPAFALRDDVIDLPGNSHLPCSEAWLAEARVTGHDALAGLVPLASVSPRLPAASRRIGEGSELAVCLMRLAVA